MDKKKKEKKKKGDRNGFTMVEVISVIAIVGILAAGAAYSLGTARKQVKLKAAETEIASAIKQAQSYALQGRVASAGETPVEYGFRFSSDQNYRIFSIDGSGVERAVETYRLPDGITRTGPEDAGDTRISFDVPHGNCTRAVSPYQLILNYGGETRSITVNSRGSVSED